MCLILFAFQAHAQYPFVVAANRDEFYSRPTEPVQFWQSSPNLLAGRDLKEGGIWMGVTRQGRFAAITNFRETHIKTSNYSRGWLTRDFLCSQRSPQEYLDSLTASETLYNGFNLLLGDRQSLYYYSNRQPGYRSLKPGIYGVSNHLLDTPWPKVQQGKQQLKSWLKSNQDASALQQILRSTEQAPDHLLPNTGIGVDSERMLSPIFIESAAYGTRASTVYLQDKQNNALYLEQNFGTHGRPEKALQFSFQIET